VGSYRRRGDHGSRARATITCFVRVTNTVVLRFTVVSESETRARLSPLFPLSTLILHPCLNAPESLQASCNPVPLSYLEKGQLMAGRKEWSQQRSSIPNCGCGMQSSLTPRISTGKWCMTQIMRQSVRQKEHPIVSNLNSSVSETIKNEHDAD